MLCKMKKEIKMNLKINNENELFSFTGNPIIDNGMAVLSVIAKCDSISEITPNKIIDNLDDFFETTKHQYNDPSASEQEKKFSKKKLKKHLTSLYTTNHYLHGENNKTNRLCNIKIETKEPQKFQDELLKLGIGYKVRKLKATKKGLEFQFSKSRAFSLKKKDVEELLKKIKIAHKVGYVGRPSIEANDEYFESFKLEAKKILQGKAKVLLDSKRAARESLCNFCGNSSDIKLAKDIFPLTSSIADFNLGTIFICKQCYLASIFSFFTYINFVRDETKSGMYFLFHFSHPAVMIEYAKQQIEHLQKARLASLQTEVGGKYNSIFKNLFEKLKTMSSIRVYQPSVTIYILLNDNRGAQYENITLPCGLLNFGLSLHNLNDAQEWAILHSTFQYSQDYIDFKNGNLSVTKFKRNKKRTLISYLKEVVQMNEKTITICEKLAGELKKYFQMIHDKNPNRRENWTCEFYDFFNLTKPFDFFNNLFQMNNEYFRWTKGENLLHVTSAKALLGESKQFNLLFNLIEYFILNALSSEEKKQYFNFESARKNIGVEL